MKIVINSCWGGFSISKKCAERMAELGSKKAQEELDEYNDSNRRIKEYLKTGSWGDSSQDTIRHLEVHVKYFREAKWYGYICDNYQERADPLLVQAVEELGEDANGSSAELKVVEIPDDIQWYIHEYDGMESVEEVHRSWG